MGSPDDAIAYARRLVKTLNDKKASFTSDDIYLPLILGGIIVDSTVVLSQEKPQDRLANITEHIRQQRPPGGTQTQRILIHSVCSKVCNTALQQYSSWT